MAPVPLQTCSQAIAYAVDLRAANALNCKKLDEIAKLTAASATNKK